MTGGPPDRAAERRAASAFAGWQKAVGRALTTTLYD
jgi:hypothetical protein